MRILKVFLLLLVLLSSVSFVFADPTEDLARGSFRTTYNYATGKIDFYRMYNGSDFCLLDGSNCALGGGANSSISGSGSANQLAFWSGPNALVGNANFTLSGTTLRILTTVNASRLLVNNVDVCLSNGTNCLSASESDPVWNGNASRVTNLETANTTLNTSVTNLITAVANLQTANGTLNASVVSLIQRIADLNASTIANDSAQIALINALQGNITVLLSNVSSLNENNSNQISLINALQGNVTLLLTNASGQQTVINNLVLENASLWSNASNQGVLIGALQVAVTNLQTGNGTMNESIGILNAAVVDLRTANATVNASVTTLLTTITTKANLTDCTGGNSTHANVSNSTRGTCILVSRNPGGGSGSTDINGSDVWLDDLNVTNLYANVEDGGVNYSIAVNAQGVTLTDTNAQSTFVGSSQIETTGQLAGGSLAIADGTWSYFESSTVGGIGYAGFNTDGGNNYLFYVEGSNGFNPGYPTFSVDSRTNTTTAEKLRVNTTLNVTTEIYVGGAIVCRSDGTNCPAYALNTHVANVNTTANIKLLGFNTTNELNVVYVRNASIPTCSGTDKLTSTGNGVFTCATDQTGGGVGSGWLNTTTQVHLSNNATNVTIGKNTNSLPNLFVDNTNNYVGINTRLPTTNLEVNGSSLVKGVLTVYSGEADAVAVAVGGPLTTYSALQFVSEQNRTRDFIFSSVNNSVQSARMAFRVSGSEAGSNSGGDLSVLRFDDSGTFIDTVMKVDRSDGYVGIGDSTPDAKLDVVGDVIIDGALTLDGSVVKKSWTNYTTAKQNVYGTTLANITGLAWGAAANTNYMFDCSILYQSNLTTNGISFAMEDWGGTVSWFEVAAEIHTVAAATVNSATANVTGTKMTSTAVTAANTKYRASLDGVIINGASAVTITPQFSAEIAGSNSSIMRGSHCDVKVI